MSNDKAGATVTTKGLIAACLLTAVLTLLASVGASYVVLGNVEGPAGRMGPEGPVGPPGEPGPKGGSSSFDPAAVLEAVEADPAAFAAAVQDDLDPSPSQEQSTAEEAQSAADEAQTAADEAQTTAESVEESLANLCSTLSLTDALASEFLSCP